MTADEKALIGQELHAIVDKFLPQLLEIEAHKLPALYQGVAALLLQSIEAKALPEADKAIDKLVGV